MAPSYSVLLGDTTYDEVCQVKPPKPKKKTKIIEISVLVVVFGLALIGCVVWSIVRYIKRKKKEREIKRGWYLPSNNRLQTIKKIKKRTAETEIEMDIGEENTDNNSKDSIPTDSIPTNISKDSLSKDALYIDELSKDPLSIDSIDFFPPRETKEFVDIYLDDSKM